MNEIVDIFVSDPRRLLPLWLALMSLVLFAVMGADKRRAKKGAWRVPEKTLFLLALLQLALCFWLFLKGGGA